MAADKHEQEMVARELDRAMRSVLDGSLSVQDLMQVMQQYDCTATFGKVGDHHVLVFDSTRTEVRKMQSHHHHK